MQNYYFCPSMNREVKRFVLSCDLCQRVKSSNAKVEGEFRLVQADKPGDLVTVDFYGPLPCSVGGVEHIFVLFDAFSKYVKSYPIKKATTQIALKKLFEFYIPEMGKPKRILADNGTQFTSPIWGNKLRESGIRSIYNSVRHPQSNPTERVMRELGRLFRTLCSDSHSGWEKRFQILDIFLMYNSLFYRVYSFRVAFWGEADPPNPKVDRTSCF